MQEENDCEEKTLEVYSYSIIKEEIKDINIEIKKCIDVLEGEYIHFLFQEKDICNNKYIEENYFNYSISREKNDIYKIMFYEVSNKPQKKLDKSTNKFLNFDYSKEELVDWSLFFFNKDFFIFFSPDQKKKPSKFLKFLASELNQKGEIFQDYSLMGLKFQYNVLIQKSIEEALKDDKYRFFFKGIDFINEGCEGKNPSKEKRKNPLLLNMAKDFISNNNINGLHDLLPNVNIVLRIDGDNAKKDLNKNAILSIMNHDHFKSGDSYFKSFKIGGMKSKKDSFEIDLCKKSEIFENVVVKYSKKTVEEDISNTIISKLKELDNKGFS